MVIDRGDADRMCVLAPAATSATSSGVTVTTAVAEVSRWRLPGKEASRRRWPGHEPPMRPRLWRGYAGCSTGALPLCSAHKVVAGRLTGAGDSRKERYALVVRAWPLAAAATSSCCVSGCVRAWPRRGCAGARHVLFLYINGRELFLYPFAIALVCRRRSDAGGPAAGGGGERAGGCYGMHSSRRPRPGCRLLLRGSHLAMLPTSSQATSR